MVRSSRVLINPASLSPVNLVCVWTPFVEIAVPGCHSVVPGHEEACVPCVSTEVAHLHRRACKTTRLPKSAGLVVESGVADHKLENPAAPGPQALVARQCSVFLVPGMSRRSVALEIRSEEKGFLGVWRSVSRRACVCVGVFS